MVVCLWKPDPTGKTKEGIFWNRGSFADFDAATAAIQKWDTDPEWTVYFTVGRMANNSVVDPDTGKTKYRRTKDHATWFKAICFDLDIGGKYATQKEGHAAVVAAAAALGMPAPMVVNSGRGIHYYWPLLEPIRADHWERVSIALRMALAEQQVEIDNSKIHDTSMVLRPVGSHHKKQTPWREVKLMQDAPEVEITTVETALSKWIGAAQPKPAAKKQSAVLNAVLKNCNLDVLAIGKKCKQIGSLLATGGEFDAAGYPVTEPLWRASLGIAAYADDKEAAVVMLCGQHPDFDYEANIKKMEAWTAAPTSCGEFEKHCGSGCAGCPYKGVASPASLNEEAPAIVPAVAATAAFQAAAAAAPASAPVNPMPDGYYISNGAVYKDVAGEKKEKDPVTGEFKTVQTLEKTLVCPYEIHVLAMYHDVWGDKAAANSSATATIHVQYPMDGAHEHELPIAVLASGGKDFASYLGNKQIIIPSEAVRLRTQTYLMNYLAKVQSLAPSGIDFKHFGWQEDGSFLCGDTLVGSPSTNTQRRLKGTAKLYADKICQKGDRQTWINTVALCDEPGGEPMAVSLLTACSGALGNISGVATTLISFVGENSGTGKTLSLSIGNSAFMNPSPEFMFLPKDTTNSLYHNLGTLGDLSGAIDEYTDIDDPAQAVSLAYSLSQGREKTRLSRSGEVRAPEVWRAATRVSSNRSLCELYEAAQSQNEPLRMRTLEFRLTNRDFVARHGKHIGQTLLENYGFALPEIAEGVIAMGGRRQAYKLGHDAFERKFKHTFRPEERYHEGVIVTSYIVGTLGKKLGLLKFDVDHVIKYMIAQSVAMRGESFATTRDALDILGQFMQEHNDQLITSRQEVGKAAQVQYPVPDVACMRMDVLYDDKTPVLPGSRLAINDAVFKQWLRRSKDSLPRVTAELQAMGAVSTAHHRVTMYKGCSKPNPGQAHCLIIDLTHPRIAAVLAGKPVATTNPAAAVLQGAG